MRLNILEFIYTSPTALFDTIKLYHKLGGDEMLTLVVVYRKLMVIKYLVLH